MSPYRLTVLEPAKAPATILLDSTIATYLPPALCATCGDAQRCEPLRPRGFTLEEFKAAAGQIQELAWDFKALCQSSTRCPLCRIMLECLKECEGYDDSCDADVVATLEPIGEYQEMGDLTWWMMFTGQTPRPTMKESIRCQLRVGLRSKAGEETIDRMIPGKSLSASNNSTEPLVSALECNFDAVSQLPSSVSHTKDHPTHDRIKTGFVASDKTPQFLPVSVRERELSQGSLTKLARLEVFEPIFTNVRAAMDSFFDSCRDEVERSATSPSSTQALRQSSKYHKDTAGNSNQTRVDRMSLSRLSIRRLGRQPRGPVDRNSWLYELENIMTARNLSVCYADLALASYWLYVCHLWHSPHCPPLIQTARGSNYGALRIIDLRRQCISIAPPRCKYAALSYTWGTVSQYKLTQGEYAEMCRSGWLREAIDRLPKTIVDAIHVCHGLGLRYLWVDALCIIQDSPEDRDAQIGSMAFVYGGASLTIVAGFGNSADAGLPGVSLSRSTEQFQSKLGDLGLTTAPASGLDSLLKSVWYTRGWTFQELVLSKRILAFTGEQMLFFCVRAFFQEDMVLEPVNGMFSRSRTEINAFDRHVSVSGHDLTSVGGKANDVRRNRDGNSTSDYLSFINTNEALASYWRFLTSYLQRNLSYEGDVLDAFSGILDALSPALGAYRWGIPVLYPDIMLTWNFSLACPLQRRAGFPSWSWTGWTGYTGDLQFHKSPLTCFNDYKLSINEQTQFYACLDHKRIIRFGHLHHRDPLKYGQDWSFTDREWAQVRTDPSQYLLLITRTAFLTVDTETHEQGVPASPHDPHRYCVLSGLIHLGHIYLRPSWRSKQPTELEFVSIAKSQYGESMMLVQRRGPVAYRIQMVEQPIVWSCTSNSSLQAIILG